MITEYSDVEKEDVIRNRRRLDILCGRQSVKSTGHLDAETEDDIRNRRRADILCSISQ
jgi:hypothetical protein